MAPKFWIYLKSWKSLYTAQEREEITRINSIIFRILNYCAIDVKIIIKVLIMRHFVTRHVKPASSSISSRIVYANHYDLVFFFHFINASCIRVKVIYVSHAVQRNSNLRALFESVMPKCKLCKWLDNLLLILNLLD